MPLCAHLEVVMKMSLVYARAYLPAKILHVQYSEGLGVRLAHVIGSKPRSTKATEILAQRDLGDVLDFLDLVQGCED